MRSVRLRRSLVSSGALLALCFALVATGDSEEEPLEVADASFTLSSPDACSSAFVERPFLARAATERGWTAEEVQAFCTEIEDIAEAYREDATLTVVTVAGGGTLDGEALSAAYYVGASGYNLTEIREWLAAVRASRGVRVCLRQARRARRTGSALEEDFLRSCLEDVTGEPYPEPLFRRARSRMGIEEVGEAAAGLGAGLAIYRNPEGSTVVAFLAGSFYAQSSPPYGAFLGCGAALGFEDLAEATEDAEAAFICVGAEY